MRGILWHWTSAKLATLLMYLISSWLIRHCFFPPVGMRSKLLPHYFVLSCSPLILFRPLF
jgi:hypothetical protein